MPQDPAGSGTSSSSSSSDLADSDRNDEDDDEDAAIGVRSRPISHEEDPYENIADIQRPVEFLAAPAPEALYDSRIVSRMLERMPPSRYNGFQEREYIETVLTTDRMNGLQDYNSSSANSLDDLFRGHQRMAVDYNRAESGSPRDNFMIPTRDPRELNDGILSLFNPHFLPNFNDMIMYVATQCDSRRTPPPRSRSMAEGEDRFFRSSSYRRKRAGANSMFFRRGLTYDARK